MSTAETNELIRVRIQSRFPLLFLATWEEDRWETELASLALSLDRGLVVWTATEGAMPPVTDRAEQLSAFEFLARLRAYPHDHVFLLKDFHPYLQDPLVVRQLRDLVPSLAEQNKTLLFMSPEPVIPLELRRDAVLIQLPLPNVDDLRRELQELLIARQHAGELTIRMTKSQQERLLKTVLGLTARQARQSLSQALAGRHAIDDSVYAMLVSEKKHMVQGSEMLEFQEFTDGVDDIGGLEALKDWLGKRAVAFGEDAQRQGIPTPKGVLLLGVQGCGKSLTARAVARLLSFPLVRLDVATLLSSDRGQSEKNLRDVLALIEMIAPTVLWMDEVEKGFAGVDDEGGGDSTMIRFMGRFLTWMQEKPAPVFVVATANSVTGLPPEMLRRGRFDELFFVDLPNYHERKSIVEIHLRKRQFDPAKFDLGQLSERTEGYSGAEIEQVVLTALVEAFHRRESLTQQALEHAIDETVPLSVTMEEKIFALREWARTRCRPATPDSRVLQMLEAEQRERAGHDGGSLQFLDEEDLAPTAPVTDSTTERWRNIARSGELQAAIYEYVSQQQRVQFRQLQLDFAEVVDTAGEFGIALRHDPHIVLWLGLNSDAAAAISRLVTDRKLYVVPTDPSDYGEHVPNRLPKLPALPDSRVSRPCWLPCALTTRTPADVDERLTRVARMKLSK